METREIAYPSGKHKLDLTKKNQEISLPCVYEMWAFKGGGGSGCCHSAPREGKSLEDIESQVYEHAEDLIGSIQGSARPGDTGWDGWTVCAQDKISGEKLVEVKITDLDRQVFRADGSHEKVVSTETGKFNLELTKKAEWIQGHCVVKLGVDDKSWWDDGGFTQEGREFEGETIQDVVDAVLEAAEKRASYLLGENRQAGTGLAYAFDPKRGCTLVEAKYSLIERKQSLDIGDTPAPPKPKSQSGFSMER